MNRTEWFTTCVLMLGAGVASGQSSGGQYVSEPPPLVPVPSRVWDFPLHLVQPTASVAQPTPIVLQPAPVVVQRPTIVTRPVTIVSQPVPPVFQPAPIVMQRVPMEASVIAQPATAPRTVWYANSPQSALYAPSLSAGSAVCCGGTPMTQPIIGGYPVTTSAVIGGVAPTVVYQPIANPAPLAAGYYVGSGLVGQPKVYVQGQPVRNALRYVTP